MGKKEILEYRKKQEEDRKKKEEEDRKRRDQKELESVMTSGPYKKPDVYKAIKFIILKIIGDILFYLALILYLILNSGIFLFFLEGQDLSWETISDYATILNVVLIVLIVFKIFVTFKLWHKSDIEEAASFFILDIITFGIFTIIHISKKIKKAEKQNILYKEQQKQIKAAISSDKYKYIERIKVEFNKLLEKENELKTKDYIVKRIKISEEESNLYINLKKLVKNVTFEIEKNTGFNALVQIYKFEHYEGAKRSTTYIYDVVKTDPIDNDRYIGQKEITVEEGEQFPDYKEPINIDSTLKGTQTNYNYYGLFKTEYIMDIVLSINSYSKPFYGESSSVKSSFIYSSEK